MSEHPRAINDPLMALSIANQGISLAETATGTTGVPLVNDIEGKLYKRTEKGDFDL